jgi:hypothetical protein
MCAGLRTPERADPLEYNPQCEQTWLQVRLCLFFSPLRVLTAHSVIEHNSGLALMSWALSNSTSTTPVSYIFVPISSDFL